MSKHTKASKQANVEKKLEAIQPVLIPLLELFAVADEVFADEGAFAPEHLYKSLGRIYREWLDCREALDPDFNRAAYRNRMKKSQRTPLGKRRAKGSPTRSSGTP